MSEHGLKKVRLTLGTAVPAALLDHLKEVAGDDTARILRLPLPIYVESVEEVSSDV